MRHQVLILNRGRKRAPNLWSSDRIVAGLCALMMRPARVFRCAVVLKTSTLLHFHRRDFGQDLLAEFLGLVASRQRWVSLNRIRRFPICWRRTRFTSIRYSLI